MLLNIEGLSIGQTKSSRQYIEPKDHMKENVRRMRQIQRKLKTKNEDKIQPIKGLWKSERYQHVDSKVKDHILREPDAPRPHSANYLRAHSRTGFTKPISRPNSVEPSIEKMSVPKAETARDVNLIRRDINFIKANGQGVKFCSIKRSPSLTALDDLKKRKEIELNNYKKGCIPKYLEHRKGEWKQAEKDRIANIPDPDLPDGHRLLPNEERLDTLTKLKQTQSELNNQIACMPVRNDTLTIRRKREELERKISDVEEAIKIFSKAKVFVRLDS